MIKTCTKTYYKFDNFTEMLKFVVDGGYVEYFSSDTRYSVVVIREAGVCHAFALVELDVGDDEYRATCFCHTDKDFVSSEDLDIDYDINDFEGIDIKFEK